MYLKEAQVVGKSCQFLIGNVYQRKPIPIGMNCKCQFLIGNVYRDYNMHMQEKDILLECQFLIGNVYRETCKGKCWVAGDNAACQFLIGNVYPCRQGT